ncbi:MAG: DoxX family protein [Syntrophales bacterium]
MEFWKSSAVLIGRILLVFIFLVSGIGKIANFGGTEQIMAQHGIPLTPYLLVGAIFCEIAGSITVILGYFARYGAFILLVFMIPTTIIFHGNIADPMQKIQFMKNVSMFGGLLLLLILGPGNFSLDHLIRAGRRGFLR